MKAGEETAAGTGRIGCWYEFKGYFMYTCRFVTVSEGQGKTLL
jgi:hypothetical protein